MNQNGRWRFGAIAGAVALVAGMASLPAHALSLGRLSVLSALGEPLRAEIEVAQITPEEASSLSTAVGTPEAFKAAGLEYTPLLAGLDVTLQRRADGRSYLRLTSSRPVSEPFVDLVLQATWSSGRLTRDYTMLFDPPGNRSSATAAAPVAPMPPRAVTPRAQEPVARRSPPPAVRAEPLARAPRAAPPDSASGDKKLTVKPGDTAGQIAAQNKPGAVSLDQMLIAMLRSNPNAFIEGNINRLKAGSVLDIPGADTAGAISASEASQTIVAQSRDFNAFRRKLATSVATAPVDSADRQAGGKVQARIEDRAPTAATPDKLTLSKGAVKGGPATATEDAIAKNRQSSDASARVAELSKNISDLNKLGAAPGAATSGAAAGAAAAASAARTPGVAVPSTSSVPAPSQPAVSAATAPAPAVRPASSPAVLPAVAAVAAASAASAAAVTSSASNAGNAASPAAVSSAPMTSASSGSSDISASAAATTASAAIATATVNAASAPDAGPASAASAPSAATTASRASAPAVLPPETNLLDDLLTNPLILPLGAVLLAMLAGLGIYSYRKKKTSAQVDSSFLESRLQPDSFFGASGGQRIDTNEANVSGSSLVYSPSQLDAAGDVDPVAEADVYLAYGRDLQAEEILKEALRTSGTRVAIHAKLAEIYAKRRDTKAFEAIALEAFNLTQGNGPEWGYITEIGRELDGVNPLYQSGAQAGSTSVITPPTAEGTKPVVGAAVGATALVTAPVLASRNAATPPMATPVDVDFDLDIDDPMLGASQDGHTSPAPIAALDTAEPIRPAVFDSLDMDFSDISSKPIALTYPVPIASAPDDFKRDATVKPNGAMSPPLQSAAPAAAFDSGMLEFDLDSLSLDLNGPTTQNSSHGLDKTSNESDHLQTKFDLAEEFRSLGDAEGARSLAEEVVAEANGPLKIKAQAFLNALT